MKTQIDINKSFNKFKKQFMSNKEIKEQIDYCTGYGAALNDLLQYIKSKGATPGLKLDALELFEQFINPKIRENERAFRIAGSFIDSSNND